MATIQVIVDQRTKKQLQEAANKDNRTLSNLCYVLLMAGFREYMALEKAKGEPK